MSRRRWWAGVLRERWRLAMELVVFQVEEAAGIIGSANNEELRALGRCLTPPATIWGLRSAAAAAGA